MTTIRDRQNLEMLDVWQNVNHQVFDREKKQIAVFPQSVKPKTERDLGAEVNTDKSIEQLNKVLETKLGSLEYLAQNLQSGNVGVVAEAGLAKTKDAVTFSQAYQTTVNTGEILPLWNQVTRYYQQQGLSKESQEMIKVKVQELKPNLEALRYGIKQVINFIFENKLLNAGQALKVMELLRTLSIYNLITSQVDAGGLELISTSVLDTAYKNVFQELSMNELDVLKEFAPRGSITTNAIRNIPDFDTANPAKRIKQIEDELGIRLPEGYSRALKQLPMAELDKEIAKLQQEKGTIKEGIRMSEKEQKYRRKMEDYDKDIAGLMSDLAKLSREKVRIQEEIYALRQPDLSNIQQEEVPEEPIEPEYPQLTFDMTDKEREDALEEYDQESLEYWAENEDRNDIIAKNEASRVRAGLKSDDEVEEEVKKLEELYAESQPEYDKITEELDNLFEGRKRYSEKAKGIRENVKSAILDSYERLDSKRRQMYREVEEKVDGSGRGKNVDTRGLASMRANYGAEESSDSESESEESSGDEFDFDDTRNEHYYTKPKSKR